MRFSSSLSSRSTAGSGSRRWFRRRNVVLLILLLLFVITPSTAFAQDGGLDEGTLFVVNNIWMLVATLLVFIMHLGFATLEAGMTQAKNTVNILFKNVCIVAIGVLTYAVIGFDLMYPGESFAGAVFGWGGLGIATDAAGITSAYNPGYTYWTDFLFQAMFAATAATIVSGAVAERVKLHSFLWFSAIYVALIYPIVGFWQWGGGWLAERGFHDFAGSTIVHSVGGWAALACVILLGARNGKYNEDGSANTIAGHSMPLATIGAFLLWFGWYGFNGGSVLSADPGAVSIVFTTTTLAAAAGVMGAMTTCMFVFKEPELGHVLNGALAGLVAVTAGADVMTPAAAVVVGGVGGVLVVYSVGFLDRLKLDDPVGAISVHLTSGVWGTLAVGIFGTGQEFLPQLIGVAAVGAFCFTTAFALFWALKKTVGIRVSEEEELRGLDLDEHGMEAYSGLVGFARTESAPEPVTAEGDAEPNAEPAEALTALPQV